MSKLLPMFPLQLVVFPGEQLNLHIFEPRYKQLIKDSKEEKTLFGIPTKIKGKEMQYGTLVELQEISKIYPDGKMDVRCIGKEVFKLNSIQDPYSTKLYGAGDITLLDADDDIDYVLNEELIVLVSELYQFMKINKPVSEDAANFRVYNVAHKIGLTLNQELALLSIQSGRERQQFVKDHLSSLLPVVKKMENMRRKIQMNGHFKNIN